MNNKQKNNITKLVFSYLITLIQTTIITPTIFLLFVPFFIIIIIAQDNISIEISANVLRTIFLGKESINETNLVGYYLIYATFFSVIVEVINKIFKKRIHFKLKQKLIILSSYLTITYCLSIVLFALFEGKDIFILLFFLFFSLIYSSVSISINHGLGVLREKLYQNKIIN